MLEIVSDTLTELWEELRANPYSRTKKIAFEISNRCNMAHAHKRCPLNLDYQREVERGGNYASYYQCGAYLSDDVIDRTLISLGAYDYRGRIAFHRYNEPLIDLERCLKLVAMARKYCPNSDILIYTNGLLLDREVIERLVLAGVSSMIISAYSQRLFRRIKGLCDDFSICYAGNNRPVNFEILPFVKGDDSLDDRMTLYDRAAQGNRRESKQAACLAPLVDITVTCDGDVVICCLDWKNENSFGNIMETSLESIVTSEPMVTRYYELSHGHRELAICQACGWSRI